MCDWPVVKETKAYCKRVHALANRRLGTDLGTMLYRRTVAVSAEGFYCPAFNTWLEETHDLDTLSLEAFNYFIYGLRRYTCFLCGETTYHSGMGEYFGVKDRSYFVKTSQNSFMYLGNCDEVYEKKRGAPFLIFSVPEAYNVIALSWTGIHVMHVPGMDYLRDGNACMDCETDSVGGLCHNGTESVACPNVIRYNK